MRLEIKIITRFKIHFNDTLDTVHHHLHSRVGHVSFDLQIVITLRNACTAGSIDHKLGTRNDAEVSHAISRRLNDDVLRRMQRLSTLPDE
jgi:hypothetical protein